MVYNFLLISSFIILDLKLIHSVLTPEQLNTCESDSLKVGSELADVFNMASGLEPSARLLVDEFVQNLGFTSWFNVNKAKSSKGVSLNDLQLRGMWDISENGTLSASKYAPLANKWLYMIGDSTTRQLVGTFSEPIKGGKFEKNMKEWSRSECLPHWPHRQNTRHSHKVHFPQEGWVGKCGYNENTCHVPSYGKTGVITFDWKHFPVEEYDEWLWGEYGPWGARRGEVKLAPGFDKEPGTTAVPSQVGMRADGTHRYPDVLTVQTNLHTCWHSYNYDQQSGGFKANETTVLALHKH